MDIVVNDDQKYRIHVGRPSHNLISINLVHLNKLEKNVPPQNFLVIFPARQTKPSNEKTLIV